MRLDDIYSAFVAKTKPYRPFEAEDEHCEYQVGGGNLDGQNLRIMHTVDHRWKRKHGELEISIRPPGSNHDEFNVRIDRLPSQSIHHVRVCPDMGAEQLIEKLEGILGRLEGDHVK